MYYNIVRKQEGKNERNPKSFRDDASGLHRELKEPMKKKGNRVDSVEREVYKMMLDTKNTQK